MWSWNSALNPREGPGSYREQCKSFLPDTERSRLRQKKIIMESLARRAGPINLLLPQLMPQTGIRIAAG